MIFVQIKTKTSSLQKLVKQEKIIQTNQQEKMEFGKIRKIKSGKDICILSHGPIISMAFEVDRKNKNLSIYSCHTLKPFVGQK